MSENKIIQIWETATLKPLSGCPSTPAVFEQEKQIVIDAMSVYTDTGEAEWVSHESCPQLHFTDGRIFIFGAYGVKRVT